VPYLAVDAAPREHPREFLWVGRLAPYKNPGAFVELARRLPEARFVMVAAPSPLEGPLRAELEAAARELPNLEVIPGLARPDVLDRLRRAVALVSTSDYEGMPNVFLEAWSRGAPVLALNHDPDDLIADHGLGTFAAGSPDRLARAAAELWRGREDQDELAARCQGFVRDEHGPELVAASWERALGLSEGYGTPGRAATQTT
jgi:glycosyltransferase involved in cell wall biosynthesis